MTEQTGELTGTKKIVVLALVGVVVVIAIVGTVSEPVRTYAVNMVTTLLNAIKGLL